MKTTVFNGSPKGKNSNTNMIAEAFLKGAEHAGAETKNIFLAEKTINHCKGCFKCWYSTPGKCVYEDNMTELLEEYKSSDIVCFATPVFTWNMTAILKDFVDRLAPLKSPLLVENNGQYDLKDSEIKRASFIVIANAGFPGESNFETIKCVFASCNPILEIYRNCGMALKKDDERVKDYLKSVEQAGFEMAENKTVSDETKAKLSAEMIPEDEYIKMLGMS